MPRGRRPSKGQVSLIGEVYDFSLNNQPHKQASDTGETVIIVRVHEGASELERKSALEASRRLAGTVKTKPNKYYYLKRPRY